MEGKQTFQKIKSAPIFYSYYVVVIIKNMDSKESVQYYGYTRR